MFLIGTTSDEKLGLGAIPGGSERKNGFENGAHMSPDFDMFCMFCVICSALLFDGRKCNFFTFWSGN